MKAVLPDGPGLRPYQGGSLLEFLNVIARRKNEEDEVTVNLVTIKDRTQEGHYNQNSNPGFIEDQFVQQGIFF